LGKNINYSRIWKKLTKLCTSKNSINFNWSSETSTNNSQYVKW
jgi:hypothetical protein